jgi:hypothetical protein
MIINYQMLNNTLQPVPADSLVCSSVKSEKSSLTSGKVFEFKALFVNIVPFSIF